MTQMKPLHLHLGLNGPTDSNKIKPLCSIMFLCVIPASVRTLERKFIKCASF